MAPSLGIVIPAFRPDAAALAAYVERLDERLTPATIRIELDDPDAAVVEELSALPVQLFAVPYRRGKGAAVTAGFEALDTDVRCFLDADGSTPVDSAAEILEALDEGAADLAVGSRRHPDARVRSHQTLGRRYLGDGFAWLARRLLDAHLYDYQCGAKAITAEAWELVRRHLYEPGFAWDVELVAMAGALDLRIEEVPIEWEDVAGSTVSPVATTLSMGKALFVARHRAKRLQHSPLHDAIAARREQPIALIDREER